METPSKATFGRFKVAFGNGNLIINNNYKVRLRADSFPYTIQPLDEIIVNGIPLNVVTARKISPDGATTIVWEMECSGGVIPSDGNSAATPSMIAPTNETSYYPSVAQVGSLYSASFTVSGFNVLSGETEYVSTDWQIAEDSAFITIVQEALAQGVTWTSDVLLTNPKNYYVRARHNGTGGVLTEWSPASLFNLGLIGDVVVTDVYAPSITTGMYPNVNGYVDPFYLLVAEGKTYGPWRIYVPFSPFGSDTGKVYGNSHVQIATDAAFTNLIYDYDNVGGYDGQTGTSYDYNTVNLPGAAPAYKLFDETQYYLRVKYVADDGTQGEYGDTYSFMIDTSRPAAGGSVATPTITQVPNATTKYLNSTNTFKKVVDGVNTYKPRLTLTAFSGTAPASTVDRSHWQIATDAAFTNVLFEGDTTYDVYDLSTNRSLTTADVFIPTYPNGYPYRADGTSYFARGKYIADNMQESAWSPTIEFKFNPSL